MSKNTLFAQIDGQAGIVEIDIGDGPGAKDLFDRLSEAGMAVADDMFVFIDEAETPLKRDGAEPVKELRHGARIHVSRCRKIATTVRFVDKTVERAFSPGVRLRTVKLWAAREFDLDRKDAAEHVLQLCGSKTRPPSDTPLHALVSGCDCAACFDLVPEKRVEG
jgi:hypothetical protein